MKIFNSDIIKDITEEAGQEKLTCKKAESVLFLTSQS